MRGILDRGELGAASLLDLATAASARILRMPGRGSLAPGDIADLVVVADTGPDIACTLAGLGRSQLRAVVRNGKPCITDPDLGEWFDLAGIESVPARLDGVPKLLARALADPAVVALEPGLELPEASGARLRATARVAEPC